MSNNNEFLCSNNLDEYTANLENKTKLGRKIWWFANEVGKDRDFSSTDTFELPDHFIAVKPLNDRETSTSGIIAKCSHNSYVIAFRGSQEPNR